MVTFKDFQVTIQANGKDLHEYEAHDDDDDDDDDDPADDSITRYIEAETGAEFKILAKYVGDSPVAKVPREGGIVYAVLCDGHQVERIAAMDPPYEKTISDTTWKESGSWYHRAFKFADLKVDEAYNGHEENLDSLKKKLQAVGTIKVVVLRFTSAKEMPSARKIAAAELTQAGNVPEEALKGESKSLFVQLGDREACETFCQYNMTYVAEAFFAKFRFKYRSKRSLRELHILECPETLESGSSLHGNKERAATSTAGQPPPLGSDFSRLLQGQNVAGLSRDELLILFGRLQQAGEQQASNAGSANRPIKRERDSEYDEMLGTATAKRIARGTKDDALDLTKD